MSNKETNTSFIVEENDSFGYVIDHRDEFESRPLILNFANPLVPGGGVRVGCRAQEEDLCRRSTLLPALESEESSEYYEENRKNYPWSNVFLSCILTKDAQIIVDSDGKLLDEPITVDIITAAAPYNKNKCHDELEPMDEFFGIENIIEMILDVAQLNGYKELVLGAFGCGAFGNNPTTVAKCFHNTLLFKPFKSAAFPILNKIERDEGNLEAFKNEFK